MLRFVRLIVFLFVNYEQKPIFFYSITNCKAFSSEKKFLFDLHANQTREIHSN